jgi:hypothetical protein
MKPIFFLPHLGLGDHILVNGLQRYLLKTHSHMVMPVKQNNLIAIKRMFQDLDNLHILPIDGSLSYGDTRHVNDAKNFSNFYKSIGYEVVSLGAFGNFSQQFSEITDGKRMTYEKFFYKEAGVPFEEKWSSFKCVRHLEKEKELFNVYFGDLNLKEGEYIVLHHDPDRGRTIDPKYIRTDLPIVTPSKKFYDADIFDYGYILENAAEIHMANSAFSDYADFLDLSKVRKKVIHMYAMQQGHSFCPVTYINDFKVIYSNNVEV